jgi:undecaprenyl-diphosphatase
MDNLEIILLALLQGLTEFLPISSSAHLVLVPQLLGWTEHGLVFDVAVHIGSLVAVLYYFRLEVRSMLKSWLRSLFGGEADQESLLAWWVIIGTLPAVLVGFMLQGPIEETLRAPSGVDRFRFTVVAGRCARAANPNRVRVESERCIDYRMLPGSLVDSGYLALGNHYHVGTLSWSDPQGGGTLFFPARHTGDFCQWGIAVGAYGDRSAPDRVARSLCIHFFLRLVERVGMLPFVIYRVLLGVLILAVLS